MPKKLEIQVNITDSEQFKNTLNFLSEILHDERIPENLRTEYAHKCSELLSPKKSDEQLIDGSDMTERKTVKEFQETGLVWFINTILHTFGWAIAYKPGENVLYPMRSKFRGFDEKSNTEGYQKVSKYLLENIKQLEKESRE